ncbi:hypothetical protein [Rummeliibacillus pycnus]|uniref:hypothetical protein n=1 Tax=Rummeliibacillus pycnus TaxID=101070 RepID=UPI003D27C809
MEIEVGYFPKSYYDSNPEAGGFFPFALEGTTPYVFSIDSLDEAVCDRNLISWWMKNIKSFPLYFCSEIPSYWKDEFEQTCKEFNISCRYLTKKKKRSVLVAEIQTEKQFQEIFPIYFSLGSENELALWSTKKDIFSVEKRKWKGNWGNEIAEAIVVKVEDDTSIFWIGYDGDDIVIISNQSHFSTYEKIIKTFPEFVVPKLCEYE